MKKTLGLMFLDQSDEAVDEIVVSLSPDSFMTPAL